MSFIVLVNKQLNLIKLLMIPMPAEKHEKEQTEP